MESLNYRQPNDVKYYHEEEKLHESYQCEASYDHQEESNSNVLQTVVM